MGYQHIKNLYAFPEMLMFKEVWACEKIHGSSAHVSWKDNQLHFFAGGAKHETFVALFDQVKLTAAFTALGHAEVTVFGEAYGGKMQGMSETYGKELKFIAFEVKIGETWLAVPDAADVVQKLGLELVSYVKMSTDLTMLDSLRDSDSVQAVRNGTGTGHPREGIVLHPLIELRMSNGDRMIAKYKGEKFSETRTPRPVNADKVKVMADAQAIALEFVTDMRLEHVLSKWPTEPKIEDTGKVIAAMIEDVCREGTGEFVESKEVHTAIGRAAAKMFKTKLQAKLRNG